MRLPIFAATLALATCATAANAVVFTDRALFDAAAPGATVEDFEGVTPFGPLGSGGLASVDFGAFQVATSPDAVKVVNVPAFGAFNTTLGGGNYLYLDTDLGFVGTITTITLDDPTTAFGFSYTDLNEPNATPEITIGGQTFSLALNGVGQELFFGFTSLTAFTTIVINSGIDSGYGVDDIAFAGGGQVVPLPATLPLALAGVAVFGFAARRRRG